MLLPPALGFSPLPPVSVYGTGMLHTIAAFLGSWIHTLCYSFFATLHAFGLYGGFAFHTPTSLAPVFPFPGCAILLRPHSSDAAWYRNFNLLSIDYAFQPRLRIRLTPGGRTFPGKPWVFGDRNSHPVFRYSCLHGHLYAVHLRSLFGFNPHTTLFYHRE